MNKYIFLDIDGVLNDAETYDLAPYGGPGIDSHHLYQLKHLIDTTGAQVVLSSDWRFNFPQMRAEHPNWTTAAQDLEYMNERFAAFNIHLLDIVNFRCVIRGQEITKWLSQQEKPYSYVILDDLPISEFYDHLPHLVHTDPEVGLTWDNVFDAQMKLQLVEE